MPKMFASLRHGAAAAATLCAFATLGTARGAESSATNFPPGVNTAVSALYPPAGDTEYFNYVLYYNAGSYPTTSNNPGLPPFHTNVEVEALRVNHTWANLAPDITLGSGFALNFINQSLTIGRSQFVSGVQFADPDIIPYNLGFHVLPNLWMSHILNIFPSWGQYSKNDVLNEGLGYSTYAPEVAVTYVTKQWEVSLDGHYDFNTKNTATNYQSGSFGDVDYIVGYRPLPTLRGLQLGISGYYLKQVQDDTQNGVVVGNGNRGQVFGYGPLVRYDIGHGGLILKWQHETAVENRTRGDRVWFQFAIPL